jgi:non-specific serine/threonine protein kinase
MLGARGDTARARALCEEAVRSSRDLGLPLPAAESLRDLGALLLKSADHRAARSCIEEGASIMARIGARRGLLEFQVLDARLAHATGELARGRAMCEEVVAAASSLRDPSLAAAAVHVLGKIALAGGDAQEAEAHARDALARRLDLGERPGVAGCLETLALAAAERGAADVAVRLHGAVARVREDMRAAPARHGDEPSRLRDRLGATAFSRAWDEGYAAGEQAASHDTGEPWPVETAPEVSAAPGPPQPARQCFRREGEYWTIAFHGSVCRLKDTKGLRYIAELLRRPGRDVHVLELVGESIAGRLGGPAPDDLGVRAGLGDAGALLDPQAKAAYRRRLAELEEEAQDAESLQDLERAERARNEIDAIARALAAAVGLGGRDRRAASAAERARSNATKAIKAALTRIAEECPEAGQHLSRSIRTGQYCSYTPEAGRPGWEV